MSFSIELEEADCLELWCLTQPGYFLSRAIQATVPAKDILVLLSLSSLDVPKSEILTASSLPRKTAPCAPLPTHCSEMDLTATLTVHAVFVLRGVSFADHSPNRSQTPKQPLQKPSSPSGGLALEPGGIGVAPDAAAIHLLPLSLRPSIVLMKLQDTVGKVLLLFLARRLVVCSRVPLSSSSSSSSSSSTPGLDTTSGVYGEDVAEDALGRGKVHFWGAGCFGIEAAVGRRIGEWTVEAGKRRRGGT
ncbi:hypothetical protein EYF80_007576 [Liparis tanakae]|uniref:Uncharacterized protein n=1 Tax=Liparis tanakae TaxID=230148 RepID=A0A4Z2IXH9_9TELE|nr:hypothetical protein EYF80_007576 [Liparis tanakae]